MHSSERPIVTQGELADKYDKASMLDLFCDMTLDMGPHKWDRDLY
jgi:hypothetical protein